VGAGNEHKAAREKEDKKGAFTFSKGNRHFPLPISSGSPLRLVTATVPPPQEGHVPASSKDRETPWVMSKYVLFLVQEIFSVFNTLVYHVFFFHIDVCYIT